MTHQAEIQYRRVRLNDHDAMVTLWQRCGMRIEPEDEAVAFERFLANPLSGGWLAMLGTELIGTVLVGADGRYGYVHHLAIHPSHRRRGIAGALVDHACRFLSEKGLRTLAVFVWRQNGGGQAFWKSFGFETADELEVLAKSIDSDRGGNALAHLKGIGELD